jgi:hypothetical protein
VALVAEQAAGIGCMWPSVSSLPTGREISGLINPA